MKPLPPSAALIGSKFAGYTVIAEIDRDENAVRVEAVADNGDKALLYVYADSDKRALAASSVHDFVTTADVSGPDGETLFISIGKHRLLMTSRLRKLLTDDATRPATVEGYKVEAVLGTGYKGVTFKVRREKGVATSYALKLTIAEEYDKQTFDHEVDLKVALYERDRDHFPAIHEAGLHEFTRDGETFRLVYFVEDLITGKTLDKILEQQPESLDVNFLHEFIVETLSAVATLQANDLMHDDLHVGNVMIHEPPTGRPRPYLIDFGSAKKRGKTRKQRDDIRNLASQYARIIRAIDEHHPTHTGSEQRVLAACESLLAMMSDEDPLRRPEDANELFERFERSFAPGSVKQQLVHPFDYGNAEEVMDNSLLYSLAAKSFPWRAEIESSNHLLVIGPRGCGKTTVFRSMSFKCLADAGKIDDAFTLKYVGLYVSCNKEFRQRFSALSREVLTRRQDEVRHYFHLIVLREFATVLAACEAKGALSGGDLAAVARFLREHTDILAAKPAGFVPSCLELESALASRISDTRRSLWDDRDLPHALTAQGFLVSLATLISSEVSPFIGKTLYLFVDDYTEGKVPREAQQALNHLLFVPNAVYKCKISSEVFGVPLDETFGNFLVQDRDYKEWNLGTLYFLDLPTAQQKDFLKEIVDNRLKLCDYSGQVDSLIGESVYSQGTLARTLKHEAEVRRERRRKAPKGPAELVNAQIERELENENVPTRYHGWDTVCDLCTGDVSNILELLHQLWHDCGVKRETVATISGDRQDAVIQAYSRQFLNKIKGIPQHGERLFEIVDAFGHMSRAMLEEHPWIERGGNRRDPYQLLRIELDEANRFTMGRDYDSLPSDAASASQMLWQLLQRHSVFVDADAGRSRRSTLSSRVVLRRILCPAFKIGLTNSESYTIDAHEWAAFCSNPDGRSKQYVKRSAAGTGTTSAQQKLEFPAQDDGAGHESRSV